MNLKRGKTVVLKTWNCNTSYVPVPIIVPWLKESDDGGNLPIVYITVSSWFKSDRQLISK